MTSKVCIKLKFDLFVGGTRLVAADLKLISFTYNQIINGASRAQVLNY